MKILIPRAFSHFREHKPSCEIRLICSCCRCAHFGSVSFPPPNRQSLKSVQSLNCVETLNSHEGNDILYHLQGQLASGFKPRSHEGNDPAREKGGAMNDMFQSTFPRGERQQLPIIFIYSPCSFLCNYTNRFLSIQVLPPITTLFSLILYKYSGANLPGNTCLLAVRTHTLPHWPVRLFLINMFPVNALYKVHLDPSHSECRISSDMQSLCRIQPWDKRRQLPLVFHLSRHPAEIHFPIYTI